MYNSQHEEVKIDKLAEIRIPMGNSGATL